MQKRLREPCRHKTQILHHPEGGVGMRRGGGDPETALSRTEPEPELETLSTVVRVSVVLSSVAQLIQIEIRLTYRPGRGGASPREGAGFYDFPLSSRQCRRNCILFPSFKEGFKEGLGHSFKELQENLPLVSPVLTHGAVCWPSFPTH